MDSGMLLSWKHSFQSEATSCIKQIIWGDYSTTGQWWRETLKDSVGSITHPLHQACKVLETEEITGVENCSGDTPTCISPSGRGQGNTNRDAVFSSLPHFSHMHPTGQNLAEPEDLGGHRGYRDQYPSARSTWREGIWRVEWGTSGIILKECNGLNCIPQPQLMLKL